MHRNDWTTCAKIHGYVEVAAILALIVAVLAIFARSARGDEPPKPRASETLHASWCTGNACNAFCEAPARGAPRVACQIGAKGVVKRAQFDRFAPGWRDLVIDRRVTTPTGYQAYNATYVGGDIAGGAMTPWQTIARPRLAYDPYRLRAREGTWICSQSAPPGPGVHGMCGWHAAGSVLRDR
mgnify:CR=1 FL=1